MEGHSVRGDYLLISSFCLYSVLSNNFEWFLFQNIYIVLVSFLIKHDFFTSESSFGFWGAQFKEHIQGGL